MRISDAIQSERWEIEALTMTTDLSREAVEGISSALRQSGHRDADNI